MGREPKNSSEGVRMLDLAEIDSAASHVRAGGVVAFPTETVYGLGADALSEKAVARVYALKGRPSINPLIVHVVDVEMAARLAIFSPRARLLASAFWPGPLTIVLPRLHHASGAAHGSGAVPDLVTAGLDSVGLRVPDHPVALALLSQLGGPIVGPSANKSGHVSPTTAAHVRSAFGPADVRVLDGGPCRAGIESTVVSLVNSSAVVLRMGIISPAQLEAVLGEAIEVRLGHAEASSGQAQVSPGSLLRHYAPKTPARLALTPLPLELNPPGPRSVSSVVIISHRPLSDGPGRCIISMPTDALGYARELYAALRQADELGLDEIIIDPPPRDGGIWLAIWDRLERATSADPGSDSSER